MIKISFNNYFRNTEQIVVLNATLGFKNNCLLITNMENFLPDYWH